LALKNEEESANDDGGMKSYYRPEREQEVETQMVALDRQGGEPIWRWALLTLDGNSTIIQVREQQIQRNK